MKTLSASLCIFLGLLFNSNAHAQCTATVSTFPYLENFETNNGGFTTGGTSSSWQWGVIAKPVITSAASGTKGWTTGGLTGSSYNNGEDSWIKSPCFNLTSLVNPQISFKVFWETEKKFDGATFEYSTNNGNSWQALGSELSDANCQGENWFNYQPVKYLGNVAGWSGSIYPNINGCQGGSGSGQWLTAKHKINFLAGNTSVMFRFRFGAGTTCNQFDGFAIDDFSIHEMPSTPADFMVSCTSYNTVEFTNLTAICQTSSLWDFGDPASGADNSSTASSPTHTFSGPGIYTVTMTASFSNNTPSVSSKQVIITQASTQVTSPISCYGENGSASVTVTPAIAYNYLWNTSPAQTTASLVNVPSGSYTVSISGNNVCTNTASVQLLSPPEFSVILTPTFADCVSGTGSISPTVTGGTPPLSYQWSNGATSSSLTNLPPGNYSVLITDFNHCTATGSATIQSTAANIQIEKEVQPAICTSNSGSIHISPSGGTAPYSYIWNNGATVQNLTELVAGTYSVTITDNNNCSVQSGNIIVAQQENTIQLSSTVTPVRCNSANGSISLSVVGGNTPYSFVWNNGMTTQNISSLNPGPFSVSVTDIYGCSAQLNNIVVSEDNYHIPVSLGIDRNFCTGMRIILSPGPNFSSYLWQNGSTSAQFNVIDTGLHWVRVTDQNGCSGTDSIKIYANCNDLHFSSAFTPNGDGLNDTFGALGDFTGLHDFELTIYGRWGQIVFHTKDPAKKWDGIYKGKMQQTQTFTYMARYTIGNRMPQLAKGTLTLIH